MTKTGYLITNGFLKSDKFDALYAALSARAEQHGLALKRRTNVELMTDAARNAPLNGEPLPGYAVFWDKDVRLARLLEARGMRLFNGASAIELCDDKALTHIALVGAVPMPKTVLVPLTFPRVGYTDEVFLERIADYLGYPFIIKECFGSFGQQVYLAGNLAEAKALLAKTSGSPVIAQEFIKASFARDARLYMVGGRCVAAMKRENDSGDFRANVALGGRAAPYCPDTEERRVAEAACAKLGLDFAGVDLLFGADGPLLCEVNSNAHFAAISEATGADIADEIMRHVGETVNG
ncbi:MAG TPA: RimK family alpha-L-glutamate ligase [Clostridia bacterium]|nr:RimK family alpha-L-glutamate ligase [Clostridia bacterium]